MLLPAALRAARARARGFSSAQASPVTRHPRSSAPRACR